MDENKKREYFDYLFKLRDSGRTNMFGAVSYLEIKFPELSKSEAEEVLFAWMDSFEE